MTFNVVGLMICGLEDKIGDKIILLENSVKNLAENIEYLEYIGRVTCEQKSRKILEEMVMGFDRLIILAWNPYDEKIIRFVRSLSAFEIEPHMVKVLDATLAINGGFNVSSLDREIIYWGKYLSQLNKNKMTLTMGRFKSKLKRRELLRLISRGFLERRFLPSIDKNTCIANYGCTKCIDYCPVDALKLWDKKNREIEVFETKCVSCGICEAVCPTNAIEVHNISNNIIQISIQEMLKNETEDITVVVSCGVRLYKELLEEARETISNEKVFNMVIECVGRMDPILNLSLLKMGVKGIVLLDCKGNCPYKIENPLISENAEASRNHLKFFGIDENKIQVVDIEAKNWKTKLEEAIAEIDKTEKQKADPRPLLFEKGDLKYKTFIVDYSKYMDKTPEGTHDGEIYGPINILVDEQKCTMCNACVVNCPSQALIMKKKEDREELVFIPANCVACKNCIEICPENAMSYENTIDIKKVVAIEDVLLKSDELARCKHCGKPIGSISQIRKVERLLKVRWGGSEKVLEHIYYCEECKKLKVLGLI